MIPKKPVSGLRIAFTVCALLTLILMGCNPFSASGGKKSKLPPTVFRGYFTISGPASGARLNLDSTYSINWSPSDSVAGGNVRISLYEADRFLAYIASTAPNTGAYSWRIPTSVYASGFKLGSGMNLRIRIASSLDTSKWDYSQYFTSSSNYSGSVAVTAPASGAQVRMDSTYGIRWTASGTLGAYMGVQLFKDTVMITTLSSSASIGGYYLWSNPGIYASTFGSGSDYRIRVFCVGDPAITATSAPFSLVSTYTGSFKIGFPGEGEALLAGSSYSITWTSTGNPGSRVMLSLVRDSVTTTTITSSAGITLGSYYWTPSAGIATSSRYRIRIASAEDPGIFAFSGYFTIKGSDPDSYEIDDTRQTAKAIPVSGESQKHTIYTGDLDWLKFNASKGKRYLISVRSSVASVLANAYDSAGLSAGVSSQSGSDVKLVLVAGYSGGYLVRISPYTGYGEYTVAVKEYDSTQSSFGLTFTSPESTSTWAAGSTYTIGYTPDSVFYGSYVNLALYMDTVLSQTISTYTSNSGSYSWSLPSGLYTSNKYRIRISSYGNAQIYAYSPWFSISGVLPDAFEPDNIRNAAKVLPADGVAQSRNLTSGDVDFIRIDVTSSKRYLIGIKSSLASIYAYVQDSLGNQVGTQYGTQFQLALAPTYTGAYYVRVLPSSTYGSYTATLVAYDSTQNGFPVKFSAPDSASTWASGSSYPLGWTADQALFGTTVSLALYLDSSFIQSITTGITNSGAYTWNVPAGLVTSAKYRIRLANYSNSTVYGFSQYFAISGLTPDTYEPDNSRGASKDITTDGAAQQHNLTTNDSDWVKFTAATGKSYIVAVNSPATVYLYVYDSLGMVLNSTSGTKVSLVVNPARAGKHHVAVRYYSSPGSYSLSVTAIDGGPGGVPVKFSTPNDSTVWAAGGSYSAIWTPDSTLFGAYVSLALYQDTTFIQSLSSSALNGGATVSIPAGLATSNRYRIRMTSGNNYLVFGHSAYFTISGTPPDALEPNDSAGAAKAVTPGAAKQALSLTYRDRDWIKFTAKAQMLYLIQATSAYTLSTTLRLYSGPGTTVLATNTKTSSGVDSVNSIAWVCPADGVYHVSVDPYSTSYSGAYGFEIKEIDPASYKFTVSAPAAGAAGKHATALTITWSDPSSVKGFVDIFLYDAAGVVQTIVANQTNLGTYSWVIPSTVPAKADYYVKVISRMSAAISGSSAAFSIAP